jgi:N-acyl-D-aspartate/D-glutamate deacylase
MAYDLKIVGGEIVNGTGAPRRRSDVGIKDGKVVALGQAPARPTGRLLRQRAAA